MHGRLESIKSGIGIKVIAQRLDPWFNATCPESGPCYNKPANACDDGNPCTADLCTGAKGCHTAPMPDGGACGVAKACKAGVCAPAPP